MDYVHQLGAAGVQTRVQNDEVARQMRERCDALGAYYEGDVRLPKTCPPSNRMCNWRRPQEHPSHEPC